MSYVPPAPPATDYPTPPPDIATLSATGGVPDFTWIVLWAAILCAVIGAPMAAYELRKWMSRSNTRRYLRDYERKHPR